MLEEILFSSRFFSFRNDFLVSCCDFRDFPVFELQYQLTKFVGKLDSDSNVLSSRSYWYQPTLYSVSAGVVLCTTDLVCPNGPKISIATYSSMPFGGKIYS